ncbi:uncharacterized protein TRIADDRAFT_37998 [Trichoplax adhaerens]|uniref:Endoplasmic reticulum-Golgi intermediate compartment protein 3 n=1 Tax=Trichoplax adhaerens TaxID=10228 RepID=B3S2A1_TRIAD|nr:hypothetical protein TRIADDRAFT_37998 [Trichoplax adhaerens]EDV23295.1 hypothetical protein TRIADDRAFT_37998 [Trichoplax adhaerens]|eukprot:XP_002114205.1 hypothetical protein TRIADDRAFT_37998 [Trichoplax adhaerens]
MSSKSVLTSLRRYDAFPKTLEDFRIRTFGGATITIVSAVIMLLLFVSEMNYYLSVEVTSELFVDTSRGEKIKIYMNVTFPKMACAILSVDTMDVAGMQQLDIKQNLMKRRIDENGKPTGDAVQKNKTKCGSCYGAENAEMKCCNSCEDVREAYRKKGWALTSPEGIEQCQEEGWAQMLKEQEKEGCNVFGYLEVNKVVAGNFHFAPGKSFQQHRVHVHDLQSFGSRKFNTSHTIHKLSFGEEFPGIINPLDGHRMSSDQDSAMYQYFIKVVPTVYKKLKGEEVKSNQYSVTKHLKYIKLSMGEQGLPGVFISYELSPMIIRYAERRKSFAHFLTGVCAIIGGVFTVASLIDAMVYHSAKMLKIELGKAS